MTACSVYWVHHPDHSNMLTQGYIGVSKNVKTRFSSHKNSPSNEHLKRAIKKYGWDTLVKKVLLIADEAYCLMIEAKLRATDRIGWNVVAGGGMPPNALGKVFGPMSEETKAKVSASKKGHRHTPEVEALVTQNLIVHGANTRFQKGHPSWRKGKPILPHVLEALKKANVGRKFTDEHKAKIGSASLRRKMTEHTKAQLKLANIGRPNAMTGKHFPKIECPHCKKVGGLTAMPRWHMDNCKFKEPTWQE
jgi:predicted GIY-YIG superfamily endonuclease